MSRNRRILVGCEFSGVVRDAFTALGYDATSCDLLPSETLGKHYQGDIRDILTDGWWLGIFHPPCTDLCVSGARWFKTKGKERQQQALDFVKLLLNAPIPHIAVENPVGIISTEIRPPDQIIQPYWFGDSAQKTTCLWLKNLPKLIPTNMVDKGEMMVLSSGKVIPKWYNVIPADSNRGYERSRTFPGIARAMAEQWGNYHIIQSALGGGR